MHTGPGAHTDRRQARSVSSGRSTNRRLGSGPGSRGRNGIRRRRRGSRTPGIAVPPEEHRDRSLAKGQRAVASGSSIGVRVAPEPEWRRREEPARSTRLAATRYGRVDRRFRGKDDPLGIARCSGEHGRERTPAEDEPLRPFGKAPRPPNRITSRSAPSPTRSRRIARPEESASIVSRLSDQAVLPSRQLSREPPPLADPSTYGPSMAYVSSGSVVVSACAKRHSSAHGPASPSRYAQAEPSFARNV